MQYIRTRCFALAIITVCHFGFGAAAHAQSRSDFETVLVPIAGVDRSPGAFGSLWTSDFSVLALTGDVSFALTQPCAACPPETTVRQTATFEMPFVRPRTDPTGALIYPSHATADNAWYELRLRDESRDTTDQGTELPVVRERNFYTAKLALVDVPIKDSFRDALRIYDVDDNPDTFFHILIIDSNNDVVLVNTTLPAVPTPQAIVGFPRGPAVAEITDLSAAFPQLSGATDVNITVEPTNAGIRFWAFASVTSDATQHVTIVTPQH